MKELYHALHNEKACAYLMESDRFYDWVVTTAFYSALHFVHYELFPSKYNDIQFNSFDEYFLSLSRKKISKHSATIKLVYKNLTVYSEYFWLYNNCMIARYTGYNFSREQAVHARELLNSIKTALSKPVVNSF